MNSGNTLYGLKTKTVTALKALSFRTGVIILVCCVPFYILSFAQLLLPVSATAKGIMWATLFGMAKGMQYLGLFILGAEGVRRIRKYIRQIKKKKSRKANSGNKPERHPPV